MRVLVIVIVVIVVTWESKANSSSSLTELQTGTELGNKPGLNWAKLSSRLDFTSIN